MHRHRLGKLTAPLRHRSSAQNHGIIGEEIEQSFGGVRATAKHVQCIVESFQIDLTGDRFRTDRSVRLHAVGKRNQLMLDTAVKQQAPVATR